MNYILILLFFIIILSIIGIVYGIIYNKIQFYIISINEAESNIDSYLRKKFDFINRIINIINGYSETENDQFEEIVKIRSRKISSFDLDRKLNDVMGTIINIKNMNAEVNKSKNIKIILEEIKFLDENLNGCKNFYNKHITNYNRLIKKFPSNLIALLHKFLEKPYFDGKDLTDEDINDFKI